MPFKPNYSINQAGEVGSVLDDIAPDDLRHMDNSALTRAFKDVRPTGLEMDVEDLKQNFAQLKADALNHQKTGKPLTMADQTVFQLGERLRGLVTADDDVPMVSVDRPDSNYTAKPTSSFSDSLNSDSDNSFGSVGGGQRQDSSYDTPQQHYEPLYTPALQNTHENTTGLLNDVTTLFSAMDGYFEAKHSPPDGGPEAHKSYFTDRLQNVRRQLFEIERVVRDIFYKVEDGRIHPRDGRVEYEQVRTRFLELRREYHDINEAMKRQFS
ncbi:hypothetical protein TRVA0_040S00364 [Trichomonascus vanleenenianus]|uniref:uncharacterized protein n=1 Tax=Trichomonascus vanleenenianus TaxID=2268995 RepID=UPI003ECA5CA4